MSDKTRPEDQVMTGSRRVISADGTVSVEKFYDKPLTKDEQAATQWFHDLSPNEQYREVRRMKWNLDQAQRDAEAWKKIAQRQDAELDQLRAKLATYTPEGFTVPKAAAELLALAEAHGWETRRAWSVREDDQMVASLNVALRSKDWTFKLRWGVDAGAGGRLAGRGLASGTMRGWRGWRDAPSLKKISSIIRGEEY